MFLQRKIKVILVEQHTKHQKQLKGKRNKKEQRKTRRKFDKSGPVSGHMIIQVSEKRKTGK